ncbi:MAG TPA: hypothetical protein VFE50_00385 [Cyclobacteriaceae bacterium]|nr:hypothetical protein [Cyclobacteriaceae bacterium]
MNSLRVLFICVALITIPVLIESCCGSCGCNPEWDTSFSINSMSVAHGTRELIPGSSTRYQTRSTPDITSSPLSKYAMVISMNVTYHHAFNEHSGGTMAAYACSPPVPFSEQMVTSIVITSNQALTNSSGELSYVAGDDISAVFSIEDQNGTVTLIEDFIEKPFYGDSFSLFSELDIDAAQHHTFTVTITLDDGREFKMTTKDIELTPKS